MLGIFATFSPDYPYNQPVVKPGWTNTQVVGTFNLFE
jgi:hypothetical protein